MNTEHTLIRSQNQAPPLAATLIDQKWSCSQNAFKWEKRCETQGYWNKSSLTGVDPTVFVSVKRVAFTTRRVVKTNHLSQHICEVPRARCNSHERHYCCWLVSCETVSLWGKLSSSWILCISSSASWDADISPRSPINSSVSCRRAFLWREWHKLQFKWLRILWFVKRTSVE